VQRLDFDQISTQRFGNNC